MSISDEINIGTLAKLANALALGASGATLLGSSPRCPTIRKNSGMTYSMSVFFGIGRRTRLQHQNNLSFVSKFSNILRCVACCVNRLINYKGKEKLAIRLRNLTSSGLRKMCQLFQLWRTSKNSLIPTLFLFISTNRCIYTSVWVYVTYATFATQQTTCADISEHNRNK